MKKLRHQMMRPEGLPEKGRLTSNLALQLGPHPKRKYRDSASAFFIYAIKQGI